MKKIKFLMLGALLFSALSLGACKKKSNDNSGGDGGNTPSGGDVTPGGDDTPSGGDDTPVPAGSVVVYLSLGEIGLYEGKKGNEDPGVFVENGLKIIAQPGTALPGADKITSTSGATFVSWMVYEGEGAPKAYSVVPSYNAILYANWSGGSGTLPDDPVNPQPQPGEITYTCTNLPDWITNDGCVIFAWVWSPSDTGSCKSCTYGSPASSLTFKVDGELTGFLLARCAAGTTLPDWNNKGDSAGRVYNQTENINCTSGTYSYQCASWKEYN